MIKPINFRPNEDDQDIIDLIMENLPIKNNSDLFRQAIFNLAISKFGEEELQDYLRRKRLHRIDAEIMREIIRNSRTDSPLLDVSKER